MDLGNCGFLAMRHASGSNLNAIDFKALKQSTGDIDLLVW